MFTRSELKEKAKLALNKNYWKIVLVSMIVVIIGGGSIINTNTTFKDSFDSGFESGYESGINEYDDNWDDGFHYEDEFDFNFSSGDFGGLSTGQIAGILGLGAAAIFVIGIIATAIGFAYSALIGNPVDVGASRFFVKSLNEQAEVKELAFVFDNNYKNVAKILFVRDVKVLLWSLLFVIPGIVKSYEYYMMPYLLAENPNLTQEEAFRLSKQMMTGNKMETFVLELSFIWWDVLSTCTFGIAGIFYVKPYKNLTYAALYEELSAINGYPAKAASVQSDTEEPYVQNNYFATEKPE